MCLNRSFAFKFPLLLKEEERSCTSDIQIIILCTEILILKRTWASIWHFKYLTAVQVIMASPHQLATDVFLVPQFSDWTHWVLPKGLHRHAWNSTMDFSQCTGKDVHSFTHPILHVSRSALCELGELTDLEEKLTQPATTFRCIFILRLSAQGWAGNYHPAWVGSWGFCTTGLARGRQTAPPWSLCCR